MGTIISIKMATKNISQGINNINHSQKIKNMQELINKLQNEHALTQERSHGVLGTITNYLKEKFPMIRFFMVL